MYKNFQWPLPRAYQAPVEQEFIDREPAAVWLTRGQKLIGSLTRFLPNHGTIEFLTERRNINLDISFGDILQLRLTRPLTLQPRVESGAAVGGEAMPTPSAENLAFHIEFINGETLDGHTAGFEIQESGLFLYIVSYGNATLRTFIPATSIKRRLIGRPIGEILVEKNILTAKQVEQGLEHQRQLRDKKLGEILTSGNIVSPDQLHAALEHQRQMPMLRIGDALLNMNVITRSQLDEALRLQSGNREKPLGEILMSLRYIDKDDLYRALSQKLGIPSINLNDFRIEPDALKAMPEDVMRDLNVIPVAWDDNSLCIATASPLDPKPFERIRFLTQSKLSPVMADAEDIRAALERIFGRGRKGRRVEDLAAKLRTEFTIDTDVDTVVEESDSTLVQFVNKMILDAFSFGVSDIHVETNPGRRNVLIRFRRDGILSEYLQLPHRFSRGLVSRLKIMADLDISEHRRAQDGRIDFEKFGSAKIELRVSLIPTRDGLEDVVLRVLAASEPVPLRRLGLAPQIRDRMVEFLQKPHGLILVVGPTGSGKTTTLHSFLSMINAPERKIWTAEDPIEITQSGLRQVHVNTRIGWTFATVMRAFLRSDPDVIMVGEMRDLETASIAIEASLTGHLVLSTLHTNSAPETIGRLLEMEIDPFSFSDSLLGVVAQRLVRRLCANCAAKRPATEAEILELAREYCHDTPLQVESVVAEWRNNHGDAMIWPEARGCGECGGTGYAGRLGVHELLATTPEIRTLIHTRAPARALRDAAIRTGMRSLRQDGIEKVLVGDTDIHQVRTATG